MKLTDFGTAANAVGDGEGDEEMRNSFVGTAEYVSPEVKHEMFSECSCPRDGMSGSIECKNLTLLTRYVCMPLNRFFKTRTLPNLVTCGPWAASSSHCSLAAPPFSLFRSTSPSSPSCTIATALSRCSIPPRCRLWLKISSEHCCSLCPQSAWEQEGMRETTPWRH